MSPSSECSLAAATCSAALGPGPKLSASLQPAQPRPIITTSAPTSRASFFRLECACSCRSTRLSSSVWRATSDSISIGSPGLATEGGVGVIGAGGGTGSVEVGSTGCVDASSAGSVMVGFAGFRDVGSIAAEDAGSLDVGGGRGGSFGAGVGFSSRLPGTPICCRATIRPTTWVGNPAPRLRISTRVWTVAGSKNENTSNRRLDSRTAARAPDSVPCHRSSPEPESTRYKAETAEAPVVKRAGGRTNSLIGRSCLGGPGANRPGNRAISRTRNQSASTASGKPLP